MKLGVNIKTNTRKLVDSLLMDACVLTKKALIKPTRISLEITNQCNFRCIICDIWKRTPNRDELRTDEKLLILKELRESIGPFQINFSGGEPTLKLKELIILSKYCSSNGIITSFNTNAYLLNPENIETLLSAGVNKIAISLDAMEAEVHDKIRGMNGAYNRALEALNYFLKIKHKFPHFVLLVVSILMSINLDYIIDVARFCFQRRIEWNYQNLMGKFAFGGDPFALDWAGKNNHFVRDLDRLDQILGQLENLGVDRRRLLASKRYFVDPNTIRQCIVGLTNLVIDCNGDLRFCFLTSPIGNWKDPNPIIHKWKSSAIARLRRQQTLKCRMPCSIAECNIYRTTFSKMKARLFNP